LNTKADFSLPLQLLILVNSEATALLLQPLTLNAALLITAPEESLSASKFHPPIASLRSPKSK
jgi:hypothetical protein